MQQAEKPKKMPVGQNFWFLGAWTGEKPFVEDVNWDRAYDSGEAIWNPLFIKELINARYCALRFMDWGATNNSVSSDWFSRTLPEARHDELDTRGIGKAGMAYEWMIDLCNRTSADLWLCVPHLTIESYEADPSRNYYTELAALVKAKLCPGLHVYLEYSNETWNSQFTQGRYCARRGVDAGYDFQGYTASFMFHVFAALRLHRVFLEVFGTQRQRVKTVISGQMGSTFGVRKNWSVQKQIEALDDSAINPWGLEPDYYGVANYIGGDIDGAAPTIRHDWRRVVGDMIRNTESILNILHGTGMKLAAYEGGHHIVKNGDVFSRNPAAYDMYMEWLEAANKYYALTMHYNHCGRWISDDAWGALEYTGQSPNHAPKYRALVDWNKRSK
ncbi:MAG: hypothetical protein ACM3WV_11180 [Bacillota bacterium]